MSSLLKMSARCLAALLPGLLLCAGWDARAADADVLYQQPLRPYPFQPIVPVNIGGKNYAFMLDTGTYGPIFDTSLRSLLGTVAQKGILSSFGVQTETEFYNSPRMTLGRLKMPEWVAPTQDGARHRRLLGTDIRGLMGIHPINDCSIWLDFDHELLKIVKDMTAVPKGMMPIELQQFDDGSIPKMELDVEAQKILFFVDTGFNGSVGLKHDIFTKFVANGVIEKTESGQAELLRGADSSEKASAGRFKRGTLLGVDLKGMDVHDSRSVSNLGMSYLLNFNLILDLAGKRLYYERRNALPPLAHERMLGGIILFQEGRNFVYKVFSKNSALRDAEIREGDHISRMGALTDTEMTAATLYELCLHHFNEIMEVEVVRGSREPFVTHMLMPRKQYLVPLPAGQ